MEHHTFPYYYAHEAEEFSFYRIPQLLITNDRFRGVSTDAKLLYGMLLDRMGLSPKNGWLDKQGRVYIFFPVEEVMAQLHCKSEKAAKSGLLPLLASGGAALVPLLMMPALAMVLVLSPAAILTNTEATEPEQQAMELWAALPDDLPMERRMAVTYALSLVGKVEYFWGGKSLALGWDERWGEPTEVTAPEDETTGTVQPFGLDCSGFVDCVFYNATGGESILSDGDGVAGQHAACAEIPWTEAQPGDLVFYPEDEHVGIVCGRDKWGGLLVVHCSGGQGYVCVTEISGFNCGDRQACCYFE